VNRADLDQDAERLLDRLARLVVVEPHVVLLVGGHTDSTGSAAVNRPLSQRRAAAVRDYLIARGVPAAQVVAEGLGPDDPVADNATEQGRQANRRSDVDVERDG
jgi:outer membrane protein OmpA-like peptidoglycan-associated protein